jgi:ring-1,2-phenylacetyl-CoA epoxidase subunit PaaA
MNEANARSILLTILGDLVLPSGGAAWLGALTHTGELVEVETEGTREALRQLAGQNIVEPKRVGRLASYALTPAGRRRLEEAADRIYLRRSLQWDGRWRLLSYTAGDADRRELARELEWLGYGSIGAGLWACPWDLGAPLDAVLAKHGVAGAVETFTSQADNGDDSGLASRIYDLDGLQGRYKAFIGRFSDDLAEAGAVDEDSALARRLILVHEWRKFLFVDPGLPRDLTPENWLGDEAARLFHDLYATYEQAAWKAWERIAAEADPDRAAPAHPRTNLDPAPSFFSRNGSSDERRTEEFRERLAAGQKVEATDWMPEEYRRIAFKFIEMHANSELMGALPEREWIARAPTLKRKRSLAAKVQDEVGHAQLIYRAAEELGLKTREQMAEDLINGRTKFHNVFHYPTYTWADVACVGFLVDGAAIVTQKALLDTSYAVYLRIMRRVVAEESLHYRHGEDIMLALASGTQEQFEMLQEAVNRWWEPILHFFGHDTPAEKDITLQWGIKTQTNEQARQTWMTTYIPKLWAMGVDLPDPTLQYDARDKVWRYAEPDWEKMNAIIRGKGPMTETRLAWRRWMRDNHAWVRQLISGDPAGAERTV